MRVLAVAVVLAAGCSSTTTPSSAPSTVDATAVDTAPTDTAPTDPATTLASTTSSTTIVSTSRIVDEMSAEDLAGELTDIERAAARGDGTVGVRQQLLYRYLSGHAELDNAVLAMVADDVRPFVARIVGARQFGQARQEANPSTNPPSTTLPAWTVVDPLPADELIGYYREAEATTGIAWYWLAAIHLQETRMGRIIGISSAGAVGPMQFLPSTWAQCCTGDPTVASDAIIGAGRYLVAGGGPADMQAALHQYNPNDSYVVTVTAFAENMRDNPQLFAAYRQWQVFYASSAGTIRLPVGYNQAHPIDASDYIADHPDDAAG